MKNKFIISIETLHLIAGIALVASGATVYFLDGIEMALSWSIFGAMYISMSDIGEDEMSQTQLTGRRHKVRRTFGYLGALGSVALLSFYSFQFI